MNKLVHGEELNWEKFKNPSREFGILPFWFWNGDMDYNEMEYQMREYHKKGMPGFFIHARFGLGRNVTYLSEEWFDRVAFTLRKAEEIGLQVWVYDEYNWPSGTAGQSIMKEDPDAENRYLEMVEIPVSSQYFMFLEGTDSRYNDLEQSQPIYACAILENDIAAGRPNFINLMPNLCFEKVIAWEAPPGNWKLFYFIERRAAWYADVLNPEVSARFVKKAYQQYKEKLSADQFGQIEGFYTDEPAMHYFEVARDNNIIPWSKNMFRLFREYNGYDLRPCLPHLFYDIDETSASIRLDYWRALTQQYEKSFYVQISDWCRENGKVFTGHLLFEENLRRHARTNGNLYNGWKHLDMMGVDHLYPRVGTREWKEEHVALKLASSAAHQYGSTRLLCESMGGFYWDCTMERMKWVADWEYVLGVNLLNPHGFHYSIEGERKRDWPASQFYHHSWWRMYDRFNAYISRLGYILSGGRHIAKAAVLYPINSIWANYTPQASNRHTAMLEGEFYHLADAMLRLHIDYDYIDESILGACKLTPDGLSINGEQYELLILPPLTHLSVEALEVLEWFADAGGKLLAISTLPCFGLHRGQDISDRVKALFKGDNAVLAEGDGFRNDQDLSRLRSVLTSLITPEIEIDSEEVFCLHRVKDGQDFYFLVNSSNDTQSVKILLRAEVTPSFWDSETGEKYDLPVYAVSAGVTTFKWDIAPCGSALFATRPYSREERNRHVPDAPFQVFEVDEKSIRGYGWEPDVSIRLEEPFSFSVQGKNALVINEWAAKIARDGDDPFIDVSGWQRFHMGGWQSQYGLEFDGSGYPVELWYAADFRADFIPEDMTLLIDGFKCQSYKLFINGGRVMQTPRRSSLDAEILEVDVSPFLKTGLNRIAILMEVGKDSDGLLDNLKLLGSFSVDGTGTLQQPLSQQAFGDLAASGYPWFSGTAVYHTVISLPDETQGWRFFLGADIKSDVLEVSVNSSECLTRLWGPYRLDVTPYLQKGENLLEIRVTNTMANLLQRVKKPFGLFDLRLDGYLVRQLDRSGSEK